MLMEINFSVFRFYGAKWRGVVSPTIFLRRTTPFGSMINVKKHEPYTLKKIKKTQKRKIKYLIRKIDFIFILLRITEFQQYWVI